MKCFIIRQYLNLTIQLFAIPTLIVFLSVVIAYGQADALVTRLSAETSQEIKFEVSTSPSMIRRGDDIIVKYVVTNNGKRPVILLTSTDPPDARVVDLGMIRVYSAFQYVDDHFPVTYRFLKISPGKSVHEILRIKSKVYLEDKQYSFENATLELNFAYIIANRPPEECKETQWPRPCLYSVSQLAQTVSVGMLVIDIGQKK